MNFSASPYSTTGLHLLYSKDVTTTKHTNHAFNILHLQENTSTMFETNYARIWWHLMNMQLRTSILYCEKEPRRLTQQKQFYSRQERLMLANTNFIPIHICPPRKFHFSSKKINKLKEKAAKFLTLKFEYLYYHPGMAVQQPRAHSKPST